MSKKKNGFTLFEIMIALFIFVIVMAIIVTGFNLVMRSRDQLHERAAELETVQLAMATMERDINQIINRQIRDRDGETILPAMIVSNKDGDFLEFTRGGLVNPLSSQARSSLIRVAYHLENGQLSRKIWRVLDRAPSSQWESRPILQGIKNFQMSYLNSKNQFVSDLETDTPRAMKIYFELPNGRIIDRTFLAQGV
jgi:general secretion pathway protein J